ncbi:family 8 carbohydrate esterase [Xylariaceae sp. FL0662B]|nr:family 8 carbohydrate esterase [Xylariaceae sp. FL0662B]
MMHLLLVGLAFAGTILAEGRTSAPDGCVTVSTSEGDFSTIQAAVDSAPDCIFIDAGTYKEQVVIESQMTLYGYTSDISSYSDNEVTVTASKSQADGSSNDESGTVRVLASNVKLYNINVENSYGEGSQAVALSAQADSGYYGCAFTGFQDTILSNKGSQLFSKSMIQGATDFIFGQQASSWFEECDLRVPAKSIGYITANGREESSDTSYYVFNSCDIAAADGDSVQEGAYYLGRPWREYARVVFQNTAMTDVVNSAGWHVWNDGDERTDNVLFGEYRNSGDGASGPRADFATVLNSAVAIESILGSGYSSAGYYDASYM